MSDLVPDLDTESLLPASSSEPSIKPIGYSQLFQGTGPRTHLYFLVGALNAIIVLGTLFSLMFLVMDSSSMKVRMRRIASYGFGRSQGTHADLMEACTG